MKIKILSFGFQKSGVPQFSEEHKGGYVFDCRGLPNPGREPKYQALTGQDAAVIEYLEASFSVKQFLQSSFDMVDAHIGSYIKRGFDDLTVCYGCTGGQHRSVYCSEQLYNHLVETGWQVELTHIDKP